MALSDVFRSECIHLGSTATDKKEILREIAGLAVTCFGQGRELESAIFQALLEREGLGSTGFQDGVAIPHCSLDILDRFVVGVITHKGLDFEAQDGHPTRVFAFIVGPKSHRSEHVRLLAGLSRVFGRKVDVDEVAGAKSAEALRESVLRKATSSVPDQSNRKQTLIHVFVQREGLFNEILGTITESDECSVSVIEANDTSSYLTGLPLFAGFWNEKKRSFHRIIIASVRHSFANEVVRRISTIAGEKTGVMVTVQDLLYCQGSLEL